MIDWVYLFYPFLSFNINASLLFKGRDHFDNGNFHNLNNEFSNKYEKNLKIEIFLWIRSFVYRLMVIQISYNFIIL
jgi:hypothetical protein